MNVPIYTFSQFCIEEYLIVSFFFFSITNNASVYILLLLKSKSLSLQIRMGMICKIFHS